MITTMKINRRFLLKEVKDNNVEQAKSFKKKTSERGFFQSYENEKYL